MRYFSGLALCIVFGFMPGNAHSTEPAINVIVFKEAGRFGGWPANHGMWIWGDEIVVGYRLCQFKAVDSGHAIDDTAPQFDVQSRSLDGGMTWKMEKSDAFIRVEDGGPAIQELTTPLDFTLPDSAFVCRYSKSFSASRFYYSTDRAKTWIGPFRLPTFGQSQIMARTDLLVGGPHDATLVLTAAKKNGDEGRVFSARTTDGGVTWNFVTWIGSEPSGFSIMPASVRLSGSKILTTIRRKEVDSHWIDSFLSTDGGVSFEFLNRPTESTGGNIGNPSSLLRLNDGRLAIVYGYRSPPYGIRARLSRDEGQSWGNEIILRNDAGCWDMGYPRSVQRSDGKIVSAYYFNDHQDTERYIAATIWSPVEPAD
jgi:hypothetical protein